MGTGWEDGPKVSEEFALAEPGRVCCKKLGLDLIGQPIDLTSFPNHPQLFQPSQCIFPATSQQAS